MSLPLFPATTGQLGLFQADGFCECERCLTDAMLTREPSEILYRARLYLNGYTLPMPDGAASPFADAANAAITILRFLECKLEAHA